MTFAQITMFLAVCEYGSVTVASEHLHISQPSITVAIKQIEEEFDLALFYRQRKRMVLTEKGKQFREMAAEIADKMAALEESMKLQVKKPNRIRIGIPEQVGVYLCSNLMAEYCLAYPEVYIKLHAGSSQELVQLLRDAKAEMAIVVYNEAYSRTYDYLPLFEIHIVGYCRRDHSLAGRTGVSPDALRSERLIFSAEREKGMSAGSAEIITAHFQDAGVRPDILMRATQIPLMLQLVERTNAVAFLSEEFSGKYENLATFTLDVPLTQRLVLLWNKTLAQSAQMKSFIEFVQSRNRAV